MGQYDRALPLCESALEICKSELGDRHPDTAGSLLNLAALYYNTQQNQKALSFIQEALQIYIPTLGNEHPTTQNANGWLQLIQQAQERDILQILPILDKSLGPDHPITQAKRRELEELRMKN